MEIAVYSLLGFTSVVGLAVVIWRGWMLRWGKVAPERIAEALSQCHSAADVPKLRAACEQHPSPLGRLLIFAADHLEWPKAENTSSLETAARREIVRLERGLVVLEIIIGIAPLLGLVGTIIGMMTVFNDIGDAGLNNASKLAQGISVILKTTLIGLLIAIPALVAWGYFSKKVEVFAVEMETLCDEFIRRQYADKK
jgi:biopolymer transport protein ExbB